ETAGSLSGGGSGAARGFQARGGGPGQAGPVPAAVPGGPMIPVLTGLGLAVAAGFNAWAVLLVFHGLVRLLPQDFPGPVTAFLASPLVFQLALALFLAEFIVMKIPLAD